MRKPTKHSLTRKLDSICSLITRSAGQCAWCKITDYSKLQCAHIFSRTYRNTRWDLKNLLPLCAGCHFKAHKDPLGFTELVKLQLGSYEYEMLRQRHNSIKKWTVIDMESLLNTLEALNEQP